MQRNKSNEIARDIIRTAKETFNEKINNITLFNLTDEPYKMFSIKFYIYFLIVRINTILSSILKYKKTLILPRIYHD